MPFPWKELYGAVMAGDSAQISFETDGTTFIRNFRPRERLILLGGGHIAQPLCRYAADLDFSVTVVDDRPSFAHPGRFPEAGSVVCEAFQKAIRDLNIGAQDYVAVITRGHRSDAVCLREILPKAFPKYLGMIGSKRRVISLLNMLEDEGFSRSDLDKIHAPIGVDINALTVKEIAISIIAELIQCRRANIKRHTKETVLVSEDIDLPLLEFLACDGSPKALLIVYETSGSTPVKSGAMMAVDKNFRAIGTIGGGCSENAILRDAYHLIGTGEERCVTVDMSNDVAEDEGMVCGGKMKVLIKDVSQQQS